MAKPCSYCAGAIQMTSCETYVTPIGMERRVWTRDCDRCGDEDRQVISLFTQKKDPPHG